ncbi:MAG: cytochrome c maturation protein CcmE [Deltaproteobacteria bacterium]|jgi:cytochrome c-type biogenesis protein CcmE|nr:cytochrome c maturation protein CcmE [Deltaproteobacteria bacterium]
MPRSNLIKILLSATIIVGAGGYLLADTMAEPEVLTYFQPADVVIVNQKDFLGQRIRMGGHVAKDSILLKKGTLEYQFEVKPVLGMMKFPEAKDKTITVRYTGVVPDTFKDDAEVIVTGMVQPDGSFVAKELLAKCPSKYEAEQKNQGTY